MTIKNLLFIDSRVANYQRLIASLDVDTAWVLIKAESDGVLQMQSVLTGYSDLDSIQVVSHGDAGVLHLGSTVLNASNLAGYSNQLAAIGSALSNSGDLLLYGCNVAQGEIGVAFVNALAKATGADVAASNNLTGAAQSGGDWILEVNTGQVSAQVLNPLGYSGVLQLINGTTANNSLTGTALSDTINGLGGADTLQGAAGDDQIYGGDGNDSIGGGDGNDNLNGEAGSDTLRGGAGNDILDSSFYVDTATFSWVTDSVSNYLYGDDGNDSLTGGNGNDSLEGGTGNDSLTGGRGIDILRGGTGIDTLSGGEGSDVYYVDNRNDSVSDFGSSTDIDTLNVEVNGYFVPDSIETVNYLNGAQALPYFIRDLLYSHVSDWYGLVFGQAKTIQYSFATTATGGEVGLQIYTTEQKAAVRLALKGYSDISGLKFSEVTDSSTVNTRFFRDSLSSAHLETYAGYANYGGDVHVKNTYTSLSPSPTIYGYQILLHEIGHSLYLKHPFEAPILPSAEDTQTNTVMTYNIVRPYAEALGMFDIAAIQYLYGVNHQARTGNDSYSILTHYIWDGAGVDTVSAATQTVSVKIDLREGSWNYVGSKSSSILAAGQSFIGFGTVIENVTGGKANDTLIGNSIGNRIDGGSGVDTMTGGDGSDTYYVDNIGDVVKETNAVISTGGSDTVNSYLSIYALTASVENGRILSTSAANLTGNGLNNVLYAGVGNNILDGLAGSDTVSYASAATAVTVTLGSASSQATGGSGSDTLLNIENLTGSNFNDKLTGNSGVNILNGGMGGDTLDGGAGNDVFRFSSTLSASNIDRINGYIVANDTIQLENAIFSKLLTTGVLSGGNFIANLTGAPIDGNDYITYETDTGILRYDADGNGAGVAVQFAIIGTALAMTAAEFVVT